MNRIDPQPEPEGTDAAGSPELDPSSAGLEDLTDTQALPASEPVGEPVSEPASESRTGPVTGLQPDADADPTTPAARTSPEPGSAPSAAPRISLDKGADRQASEDPAVAAASPAATPAPGYPPRRPVSTRLRVGTAVWGLMLAAAGVWIIAWAGGARIDAGLALIVLLAGGGAALLVGSIVAGSRHRGPRSSRGSAGAA
ncbi:hypothetical protein IC607_14880 [Cellulomonas sp. JH27-2]|uniref:hypothetical protein n=1 Tax=Cellulomonas sp. JH27-2 TaxID=2774139 RepID=UPI001780E07D|nr:hypothetical protein [Cellulomonas sp. JH27-2]MBD8060249.1 hypothetical protein [Cellulomonas sp. JH27-2]